MKTVVIRFSSVTSGWAVRTLRPDDQVARALTWFTISSAVSKEAFFSVSVLFFTRVVGLSATTVGVGLTLAGGVAVGASLGAGYLAGLVGAQRVLLASTVGQGLALLAYVVVRTPAAFVVVACAAVGQQAMARTALWTMIAQTFTGPERVEVRARLRVISNAFIGLGTAMAAVALAIGTRPAYLLALLSTAALLFASAVPLRRILGVTALTALDQLAPLDQQRVATRGRSPLRDCT